VVSHGLELLTLFGDEAGPIPFQLPG
jgi:hypothetical protein